MENGTRMLIVLGVFIATYILLEWVLGKWLKIEKKKKGYHNEQHKDWEIKTSGVLMFIILISFMMSVDGGVMRDVLPYVFIVCIILQNTLRVYWEWKYSDGSKEYIRMIITMSYMVVFFITAFATNFYWAVR
ncbi:DUF4181 domain-containing protein [Rossellomorea marisflavi]|uniref:DUF4181 domain-containing protein n=1 Tax=Rossellomorea marisflavi TaxID=189381 RepID=UPI00203F3C78|nr:DUF4181 domain-containing protein [Rossellomorea marisflavi]MCM2587825.1 DUF4181 domain-containing protein [Rossellomorea marisflavi]MDR4938444.1 DUF4181 domain-containing protein [Rossellomorea marisflavi]